MSQLSWGKCTIEKATSTKGTPAEQWTAIDTPKEDTTKLTPTAGTSKEATEEGGELVDSRTGKTNSHLNLTCSSKRAAHARLKTMTD